MPSFKVSRSININASAEKIYETLTDFHHWQTWSPWLIQEPEARVTVREDGKYYEWEGKRIGSGNMTFIKGLPNESIEMDLMFLKPWKSKSLITFKLRSHSDYTELTWNMDGSLPFFMFWMKGMMDAWVGMDFERGLMMLKEYVELGAPQTKLDFKGKAQFEGGNYIGVSVACGKKQLPDTMKKAFGDLHAYFLANPELSGGKGFSTYSVWNPVKDKIEYTSGFFVKEIPSDLPGHFVSGNMPATSVYTVKHTGPYHHMGNAWSTLYTMQRNKVFKKNKRMNPFELYVNSPMEVAESELVTEVSFPIK